jgi:hypothetical protein
MAWVDKHMRKYFAGGSVTVVCNFPEFVLTDAAHFALDPTAYVTDVLCHDT